MLAGAFANITHTFAKLSGGAQKNWGSFKKCKKNLIFGGRFPRQGMVAETFLFKGILAFGVRNW